MTTPLLIEIGTALYGEGNSWESRLAEDLGVNERTMRRWLSGESAVPAGAWTDLANIALGRARQIADLIPKLQERAQK